MLDNLKLGYGGTKSEMERLLSDAQKITGVKYDINNLSDVYSAIHVIQGELGITGTTANEAATTVSGSFGMLKASFTDLMGNLALGQNVGQSLQNVITSAGTFMANLIPMVVNVITSIPAAIIGALPSLLPTLQQTGKTILENITGGTVTSLPQFLNSATNMITKFADTILKNIPKVITVIGNMISKIVSYIMQNLPTILATGVKIIGHIAKGLIQNLPAIVGAMAKMFVKIVSTIGQNLPTMLAKGGELIGKIVAGIIKAIPTIVTSMPKVISAITDAFSKVDWATMGKNIIQGIINGITAAAGQIGKAMSDIASSALSSAKKALGIHSPSRVMAKEVGQYIPEGIAMGIDNGLGSITEAMNSATEATTKSFAPIFGTSGSTNVGGITMNIYGAEGQDVNALADIIETRLSNSINRREAVYA
jgi:phage-related protein